MRERIEFNHVVGCSHHILGGENFLAPTGLRNRDVRDDPGMCRGANAKTSGADTGSDGASVAAPEAERQAGDSVGDARFNQYRRLKLTTTGRDGDNVALRQRTP